MCCKVGSERERTWGSMDKYWWKLNLRQPFRFKLFGEDIGNQFILKFNQECDPNICVTWIRRNWHATLTTSMKWRSPYRHRRRWSSNIIGRCFIKIKTTSKKRTRPGRLRIWLRLLLNRKERGQRLLRIQIPRKEVRGMDIRLKPLLGDFIKIFL